MKKLLFFLLIILTVTAYSQDRSKFLYAGFSDRSSLVYPFHTLFGNNFDPAITIGAGIDYKQSDKFTLLQTFQLTGYSSYLTGKGITMTSSLGYRYNPYSGFFGEALAGLGATVFMPSRQTYSQNEDGKYIPVNSPIIRATLPVDLILGYRIGSFALYLQYRYMFITPYTDLYWIPVTAVSHVGIGMRYTLSNQSQE